MVRFAFSILLVLVVAMVNAAKDDTCHNGLRGENNDKAECDLKKGKKKGGDDKETSSIVCDEEHGDDKKTRAFCKDFCAKKDCANKVGNNKCDKLRGKFEKHAGESAFPCEVSTAPPCPCFSRSDLDGFALVEPDSSPRGCYVEPGAGAEIDHVGVLNDVGPWGLSCVNHDVDIRETLLAEEACSVCFNLVEDFCVENNSSIWP